MRDWQIWLISLLCIRLMCLTFKILFTAIQKGHLFLLLHEQAMLRMFIESLKSVLQLTSKSLETHYVESYHLALWVSYIRCKNYLLSLPPSPSLWYWRKQQYVCMYLYLCVVCVFISNWHEELLLWSQKQGLITSLFVNNCADFCSSVLISHFLPLLYCRQCSNYLLL
jgi:hypothetical protein